MLRMTSVMSASTTSPLRVAIIGAGQVADKVHASYYATRSDVQMVAVMDSRLEQAQAFAERYAIPSAWQDAHEMLQEVKPDVVSVCSPNRFHFEHVMASRGAQGRKSPRVRFSPSLCAGYPAPARCGNERNAR